MSDLRQVIKKYLESRNVMQLASVVDGQPWVCNLHYYSDDDLNIYWISTEARRHSVEIKQNQKVAAAVLVHENTPEEKYIIGLSIEGTAELLGQDPAGQISQKYTEKLQKPAQLMADIKSGKNPHKFYLLKPTKFMLCDTKEFPDAPWQELRIN